MDEFINTVENNRVFYKNKLKINLIVGICFCGMGLLFLILYFAFIENILLFFISIFFLIIAIMVYGIGYSIYNKKYINSFKNVLTTKAIEANYASGEYYYNGEQGINLKILMESRSINNPDKYSSNKYFSGVKNNLNFVSCDYVLGYVHDDGKNRSVNYYRGKFIRYEVKRNNNVYLSIFEKNLMGEAIKDPRLGDKIEFEYIDFNNKFKAKTNDPLKANYLITPQVQVNLMDFDAAFKSSLGVCLIDNYIYVFMHQYNSQQPLGIYKKFTQDTFRSYSDEFLIPLLIGDALDLNADKYSSKNL